jgi:hypothetical protein
MKRRLACLLSTAALALMLVTVLAPATAAAVSASFSPNPNGPGVTTGPTITVSGMTPGDQAPARTVELRADRAMRYRMHVTYTGSQVLAETLVVSVAVAGGPVLYEGPLAGAKAGGTGWTCDAGLAVAGGQTVTISVSVMLPLDAGNEVVGVSLEFSLIIESVAGSR